MNWFDLTLVSLIFAAILIITIGLPHGATDLLLFKHIVETPDKKSYTKFLLGYLSLIAVYGLVWFLFPKLALSLFIIISIYHFGQSNWSFTTIEHGLTRIFIYFLSGSFVILTPLCIHYEMTLSVIEGIAGITSLSVGYDLVLALPRTLLILNIWALFYIFSENLISKKELLLQVTGLVLLMLMYYSLPLILGFTIYFVLWHSFGSMIDQVKFIRAKSVNFSWSNYFKNALPNTIIAILFIISCFSINYYFKLNFTIVQIFFVILSLFTLPHILLIEQLYTTKKNEKIPLLQLI